MCSCNSQSSPEQYRKVFFIAAAISFSGRVFFLIFGSGEQQSWDKLDDLSSDHSTLKADEGHIERNGEHFNAKASVQDDTSRLLSDNILVVRDYGGTKLS